MTTAADTAAPWPPERRGWFVVAVLCACVIVSFIDRQIINLLVEDLRRDLQLTDTSISLLQGLAFALFYAACGLPLGRMADHRNRKWMIASGLA
ncbi:MAG: MFS transporter, partial [Rubrivivax sp.]|nr:MFS transporter [Rubrivivax sp.]